MLLAFGIIMTIIGGSFLTATIYNLSLIPKRGLEIPDHKTTIIRLMVGWFLVTVAGMYLIGLSILS